MSNPNEIVPKHFKEKKDLNIIEQKRIEDTPTTFFEIQQQQKLAQDKFMEQQNRAIAKKKSEENKEKLKNNIFE